MADYIKEWDDMLCMAKTLNDIDLLTDEMVEYVGKDSPGIRNSIKASLLFMKLFEPEDAIRSCHVSCAAARHAVRLAGDAPEGQTAWDMFMENNAETILGMCIPYEDEEVTEMLFRFCLLVPLAKRITYEESELIVSKLKGDDIDEFWINHPLKVSHGTFEEAKRGSEKDYTSYSLTSLCAFVFVYLLLIGASILVMQKLVDENFPFTLTIAIPSLLIIASTFGSMYIFNKYCVKG